MTSFRLVALLFLLVGSIVVTLSGTSGGRHVTAASLFAQDGTTASGEPVVITAQEEARQATPSGEQVLEITGPVQGPETLDPALARDLGSAYLMRQIYRGLTRLDQNLEPVPELAERIEVSADGLEYTFMLRSYAAFQNGRTITADDVVFSLTHALDPATAGGEAALLAGPTFLADIEGAADVIAGTTTELRGVRAVDERTVVIRLATPRATFLMKLASAPAMVIDRENVAQGEAWWQEPNGSGPFRVEEWEPGDHLTLERYEGFYGGSPPLERIEVRLGTNAQNSFNLYQSGQVDIDSVPLSAIDRVMDPASPLRNEVTVVPLFAVDYVAFRTDTPPMDDPHVRRAIHLAFPRDKVARVTYDGHLNAAAGMIPNGMLGRDWPVQADGYDLEAARQEIAASRYGSVENVPVLRIYLAGNGASEALRDTLQADLGLQVEVIAVEWPEFLDGLSRRQYPAYELYWGADYPDPESLLWTLFGSDSADNYVDYHNPVLDELLAAARAELDPNRRAELYAQAQQVLMDDHVVIPFYTDVGYTIAKPYVKGLEVTSLGIIRLDTIWLER